MKMKAISVLPGKPNSVHLTDLAKPALDEVPGGRGVLVKVLRVGVDGTDKEINAAEYGAAPPGYDFLVIGHEGFGRVEAVGPNVTGLRCRHRASAGEESLRRHRHQRHDN
jgi:glucose 1-dehydrogenase